MSLLAPPAARADLQLKIAALMGALAVGLGAFGAHGLQGRVTPERLSTWETSSRYHLFHAILLVVLATRRSPSGDPSVASPWTFRLILAGTIVFSASLYALVLLDLPILGAVTPLGGILLIAGWLSLLGTPTVHSPSPAPPALDPPATADPPRSAT